MTKQDVLRQIEARTGLDPIQSQNVLETFFEVVKQQVAQGQTIYLRTFGSFGPKHRAAKLGRNITQNTTLMVAAHTIPLFKPSNAFVEQVRQQPIKQ